MSFTRMVLLVKYWLPIEGPPPVVSVLNLMTTRIIVWQIDHWKHRQKIAIQITVIRKSASALDTQELVEVFIPRSFIIGLHSRIWQYQTSMILSAYNIVAFPAYIPYKSLRRDSRTGTWSSQWQERHFFQLNNMSFGWKEVSAFCSTVDVVFILLF